MKAMILLAVALTMGIPSVVQAKRKRSESSASRANVVASPELRPSVPVREFGRLRVWKLSDSSSEVTLQVKLRPLQRLGKEGDTVIFLKQGQYVFNDFTDIIAGLYQVEVGVPNAPPEQLRSVTIFLPAGARETMIVSQIGNATPSVQMVDDTPTATGEVVIYNLLSPGSGDFQISVGDLMSGRIPSSTGNLRLRGLGKQIFPVSVGGRGSDGRQLRWSGDLDLRQLRQASVVICTDAYGRFKPRIIMGDNLTSPSL